MKIHTYSITMSEENFFSHIREIGLINIVDKKRAARALLMLIDTIYKNEIRTTEDLTNYKHLGYLFEQYEYHKNHNNYTLKQIEEYNPMIETIKLDLVLIIDQIVDFSLKTIDKIIIINKKGK